MCVRALCDSDALFQRSHSHFTLHTSSHLISSELFSPHLSSSHLISSLLICHLSSSQLLSFHLSTAQPFASHRSSSQPISALLHVRKLLPSERNLLHTKTVPRRKLLHREGLPHRSLRHRCVYRRLQPLYPKKTQWFALGLPHQDKSHATFMQPLQYVLQHHLATRMYLCTWQTQHGNIHAAIPLRSATRDSTSA